MATILKLGTLLLDGAATNPGAEYRPNQEISFGSGKDLRWVVVNGLLIADRPLLINISWDDLNRQGLVFGEPVTINGQQFLCRLLKVGTRDGTPNEWDAALDAAGKGNGLWHWDSSFFWGQETPHSSNRALRGYESARHWNWSASTSRAASLGFRPVLDPLPAEQLAAGDRVCAIGGQSALYGDVLELTNYDIVLSPSPHSKTSKLDNGKLYRKMPDGTIGIEHDKMIVQKLHGRLR